MTSADVNRALKICDSLIDLVFLGHCDEVGFLIAGGDFSLGQVEYV